MTIDLDALEALAKAAIINDDPEDWPLEGAVGWDRPADNKFVAALTPGTVLALIAELRQERERADAEHYAKNRAKNAHLDTKDALSRAEEAIEKVREMARGYVDQAGAGDYYIGQESAGASFLDLLTEYDKQKEQA